jgi:hypothetical protein
MARLYSQHAKVDGTAVFPTSHQREADVRAMLSRELLHWHCAKVDGTSAYATFRLRGLDV